jgi:DNA polymerase-4
MVAEWPRAILHVDMDAFYASVEVLDNPALAGKPVVVGGSSDVHGVVAAASYEARAFGIRSAMPMVRAMQLCPGLIRVPGRHGRYGSVSKLVFGILGRYTGRVEPVSIDEAYMDVTGSIRLFGTPPEIARAVKDAVRDELRLTCSVGVATNRLVSKIASDLQKPDGLVVVEPGTEAQRLAPLPIERLPGIGPKTARTLHEMCVRTLGELAAFPVDALEERFGDGGRCLAARARGDDEAPIGPRERAKSISSETTLERFTDSVVEIDRILIGLADQVARRVRRSRMHGRCVTLKLRDDMFKTRTRSRTLDAPTDIAGEIAKIARELYADSPVGPGRTARLLGVALSELTSTETGQSELFIDHDREKKRRAERAMDEIRDALGSDAMTRGVLLDEGDAVDDRDA